MAVVAEDSAPVVVAVADDSNPFEPYYRLAAAAPAVHTPDRVSAAAGDSVELLQERRIQVVLVGVVRRKEVVADGFASFPFLYSVVEQS